MKRIIKKSTTITESIVKDDGEILIVDRRHDVNTAYQWIREATSEDLENWQKWNQIYRQEITNELEEYKKKNPSLSTQSTETEKN